MLTFLCFLIDMKTYLNKSNNNDEESYDTTNDQIYWNTIIDWTTIYVWTFNNQLC